MATKKKETEVEAVEEEVEILPKLTGLPIEVHIRRHFQFILVVLFVLFLGIRTSPEGESWLFSGYTQFAVLL